MKRSMLHLFCIISVVAVLSACDKNKTETPRDPRMKYAEPTPNVDEQLKRLKDSSSNKVAGAPSLQDQIACAEDALKNAISKSDKGRVVKIEIQKSDISTEVFPPVQKIDFNTGIQRTVWPVKVNCKMADVETSYGGRAPVIHGASVESMLIHIYKNEVNELHYDIESNGNISEHWSGA